MRFVSSHAARQELTPMIDAVTEEIARGVDPRRADLLTVFTSGLGDDDVLHVVATLRAQFPSASLLGCTAEGTIGTRVESERVPSISVMVGELPGVAVVPFVLKTTFDESGEGRITGNLEVRPEENPALLALGDPFSFEIRGFLDFANERWPGVPIVGGFASQARRPGGNLLFLDGEIHRDGLIGVSLSGPIRVRTVLSQGCRPIGSPFIVTKAENNVIRSLRNQTPLDALREITNAMPPADKELLRRGLFVGRAIDEYRRTFERGDFLIQGVTGADTETGAMEIGGEVRVGTTVQFHVRDARSADEDLRHLLALPTEGASPRGGLLFSCNGRGTRMWDEPGHDAGVLDEFAPGLPLAGIFAAGEFGPVGGKSFVHGFTASLALIGPA